MRVVAAAADDIRILATSREPLGLPEEARYRLPPLALPGPDVPGRGPKRSRLFVQRARQIDPELTFEGESGAMVERLVWRLDGIPLAIELAAARVEVLGLAQLADRLDDRLRLLVSANRGVAARQRSLEAAVDWSYQLLSGTEQHVFRRLSVFPGPFTLDAARRWPGLTPGLPSCAWSTARCWCRRVPGRTGGLAIRCWRRCAAMARVGSARLGRSIRLPPRWPCTRCTRPNAPPPRWRSASTNSSRRYGWMLRTPPCTRA